MLSTFTSSFKTHLWIPFYNVGSSKSNRQIHYLLYLNKSCSILESDLSLWKCNQPSSSLVYCKSTQSNPVFQEKNLENLAARKMKNKKDNLHNHLHLFNLYLIKKWKYKVNSVLRVPRATLPPTQLSAV